MKAQSLEQQLRNAVPPAPDTEARLRARRAGLAEFARVHSELGTPAAAAQASDAGAEARRSDAEASDPAAAGRGRNKQSLWPLSWPLKSAWLGGMATACVVVVGVSVVYLMPEKDREIRLNTPIPPASAPEVPPAPPPQATNTQPAESEDKVQIQIAPKGEVGPAIAVPAEPAAPTRDERRQEAPTQIAGAAQPKTSIADVTERPAPRLFRTPPAAVGGQVVAGEKDLEEETSEVAVTSSSPQRQESYNSPSAIVSLESNALSDVSVTGARTKGRLSKKASALAPAAPPPAAARDEGRDKFQHFDTNPVKQVTSDPVSTFSVDVDTAAYSFVRRKLNEGVMPQPDAVRVEEMINYFDYAWPTSESRDEPFKPTITVSDSPWGSGKKLVHIGIKGYALPASQQPDVNLVLLLDVSGSMDSPDKLPLAKRSMALLLDSLRPTDTVAIVVYAGQAGQVLAPTPVREKETILHALESLQPGGSTAGAAGIQLAYALAETSFRKGGVNRILLATDGDFNVGITDQNELKGFVAREREKGVYLSVLGFGEGNYRDEMAQTLAQNGNGVAAYIDTVNEAKKVLVQEATSSLFPIAKDVKLQVEFNPATVAEYRLVGYEARALNREDFNNDKVDAGDVGSGHTVTAIYEITPVGSKSTLIDPPRYSQRELQLRSRGKSNEYGFLKIRYKLPNGSTSRLLEQPIRVDAGVPAALRDDVAFSTAVAGFGQLLRGSQYVGSLSYEDVLKQAQAGVGADRFGYRTELVQLVSKAQRARGL
jgi:Ca-activated chloride channel family protein